MAVVLHHGDCREALGRLPAESVQCCVTSPPYFGLRDYGVDGQIGLEQSPQEYVEQLVAVFREVRRVLKADGTLWLNLGDSYATAGGRGEARMAELGRPTPGAKTVAAARGSASGTKIPTGLKPKDLMMIPNRVAIALQADGWWVRSEIIWSKAAPMPESVRDRPTCAHEKVWLLTKAASYFYDADAVREPLSETTHARGPNGSMVQDRARFGNVHTPGSKPCGAMTDNPAGRNLRNVWHLNPEPFPGAHFATMPPTLAERCIKAGTSEKGCCPTCGAPWVRVVERIATKPGTTGGATPYNAGRPDGMTLRAGGFGGGSAETTGWQQSCSCPPHEPVPQTVLDPFAGAGTTLMVADRLQRNAIGIELNEEYVDLARRRLSQDCPLFADSREHSVPSSGDRGHAYAHTPLL